MIFEIKLRTTLLVSKHVSVEECDIKRAVRVSESFYRLSNSLEHVIGYPLGQNELDWVGAVPCSSQTIA